MSLISSTSTKTIHSLLKETFENFDTNSIFVANNNNNIISNDKELSSSIDVKLSPSDLTTFSFEELQLSISEIESFQRQFFIKSLPFPNFDSLWKQCILSTNSSSSSTSSMMKSIRLFFAACRHQRDPRCLRFRESIRFERIFERKLFDLNNHQQNGGTLDLYRLFFSCCCTNHHQNSSSSPSSSPTITQAKVIEAWLSALDYYFYYFPEFRFPVPDGQAAQYSKFIKNPMSFSAMYSKIRNSANAMNKRTFFAHLEQIARNCIHYNGSESLLARRANELVETSFFRDATGHIPTPFQKNFPSGDVVNNNNNINIAEKELTFGEDPSMRWFNEALKPGQFVVAAAVANDDDEDKNNNSKNGKKTKVVAAANRKKTLGSALNLLNEKESGKRRKRNVNDNDDESSSGEQEADDDEESSYNDDDDVVEVKKPKETRGRKPLAKKSSIETISKTSSSANVSKKSHHHQQILSAEQLQDIHATLLAIWSSVIDDHCPRSEKIIHELQQQQQNQINNNINNNNNTSRGRSVISVNGNTATTNNQQQHQYSPSIRRSITTGNLMNNNNSSNAPPPQFTREALQELLALKALSEMVDEQVKLLEK